MSCNGCGTKNRSGGGYTQSFTGRWVHNDVMTAAAMCASCPKNRLEVCTIDGEPITKHARGVQCPTGRYPEGGFVRWMFIKWIGVPYPIRIYLKVSGKITGVSKLPGCGCIKALRLFIFKRETDGR